MCRRYDEFVSTREMVERLKDIICKHKKNKNVFDNDVAAILRINIGVLATRIARNSPPITEILLFCNRVGLDINEIVFKKISDDC